MAYRLKSQILLELGSILKISSSVHFLNDRKFAPCPRSYKLIAKRKLPMWFGQGSVKAAVDNT